MSVDVVKDWLEGDAEQEWVDAGVAGLEEYLAKHKAFADFEDEQEAG